MNLGRSNYMPTVIGIRMVKVLRSFSTIEGSENQKKWVYGVLSLILAFWKVPKLGCKY